MKCPNCAAPADDGAHECPSCGIVFAKWREREQKKKGEIAAAIKALESPSSEPAINPWIGRAIAGVLVAAWLTALAAYYFRNMGRAR